MPSIYSSRFLAVVVLYFLKIDVTHIVLRAATFRRATTACTTVSNVAQTSSINSGFNKRGFDHARMRL
mgnify:CR=1 FL=1